MSTFLKIYNEDTNLEVGRVDNYLSIATDNNDPTGMGAYAEVKLSKNEVSELIDFLQKKMDELE